MLSPSSPPVTLYYAITLNLIVYNTVYRVK